MWRLVHLFSDINAFFTNCPPGCTDFDNMGLDSTFPVIKADVTCLETVSFGLLSGLLPCTNSLNKTALEILVSSIQHMCPTHQRCSLIVWLSVLGTTHHSRTLTLETLANHLILQMDHRQHYWNCWRSLIWQR